MNARARELALKLRHSLRWLPSYFSQRLTRPAPPRSAHLIVALADHFEPSIVPNEQGSFAHPNEQRARVERWCREYPKAVAHWRDSDGRPFRHTYFFPAEQYDKELLDRLADHCHQGWGEVEIHLHHGVWVNLSAQSPTSPGPDRFFAAGEEKTTMELPSGYGYPFKASDRWLLVYMLHNQLS